MLKELYTGSSMLDDEGTAQMVVLKFYLGCLAEF